jgi:hypothetical protein
MGFSNLSSCELIGLASSLAIAIGENLSADDVASLAAFTTALGDNLAIIATQKSQNLDNANC